MDSARFRIGVAKFSVRDGKLLLLNIVDILTVDVFENILISSQVRIWKSMLKYAIEIAVGLIFAIADLYLFSENSC